MTNVNFFNRLNRVRQFAMDALPLRYLCITLFVLILGIGQAWAATQKYVYVGISNNYQNNKDGNNFGLNVWGGTSGGVKTLTWIQDGYEWDGRNYTIYRAQVYDDNNKAQFKGNANWWDPSDGFSISLTSTTNNAIFFSHSNDGWGGQFQQNYQVSSNASLAATSTTVATGTTVTLTPSLSSNSTYNDIKSTTYTVSTNPNNGGSLSGNVFSATLPGSYTVTATVTYNAKGFTGITKTATATTTITVYGTFSASSTIVWDLCGNEKDWSTAYLYKELTGGSTTNDAMTQCGSTTQYRKTYASAVSNVKVFLFRAQNGSTWSDYKQTTDLYRNVSGVTLYEFINTYDGKKLNWAETTGAKKATSGVKVYFDKTNAWNGEIWLKYGTTRFNRHTGAAATKVTGTENLYVITMPEAYYTKWYFASSYGWTDRNTIEDTNVGNRIPIQTTDLTSDITFVPTGSTSGSNPTQYAVESFSGHTRRLTFGSHTNGQITVRYTDEGGTERTVSSASASYVDVAQTCNVVITAVPNSGYAPDGLELNSSAITSGATQTIRADGTIDATFVAEETHNVTVSYKYGTRELHADAIFEVGVTTASPISAEVIDGFQFSSWSNLTNVTNSTALDASPISINTIVGGSAGSMTCNYTPWTCSLDLVASQGATGHSSRTAMSYDATEGAYYINRTTTSATERYRFYINGIEYSTDGNVELQINETKVDANVDVTDYLSNKPSVYFNDGPSGSKITIWFNYETKKAWVTEQKHTVTITAGDHGSVSPGSVTAGAITASATITAIADDNYHWDSWTLPNSGVTIASGSGTRIITINATADDKEVIANFAGDQYTISYKDKGNVTYSGDNLASLPNTHTYGTATTLVNGSKTGYDFDGWYTDQNCTTSAGSSIGATVKTANFTLYAKWTAKEYSTTNNIKHSDGSNAGTYTATYDATSIALNTTPSKTGYNITNYYKENTFTTLIANTDLSLTSATTTYTSGGKWKYTSAPNLYVKWTAKQYNITLDKKEGTADGSAKVKYDATKLTNIYAPTKSGYHVEGYYGETGRTNKVADASGNLQSGVSGFTTGTKWTKDDNATLFTKWEANTYTISFDADDESRVGTATNVQSNVTVTFDAHDYSASTVAVPVLTGYTFDGYYTAQNGGGVQIVNASGAWQANKTNYTDGSKNWIKAANTTLYAKWTAKTYTVSFNARGGSSLSASSSVVTFGGTYGAGTCCEGELPTVTAPSGCVFSGWYDAPSGGRKIEKDSIVLIASDHTLYAQHTKRDRVYFYNNLNWSDVYVTYDAYWDDNKGTGNHEKIYHKMTQITGSSIYYDDIPDAVLSSWKYFIAFNSVEQLTGGKHAPQESGNYGNYDHGEAVYRHDFDSKATMFVPKTGDTWRKNEHDGTYCNYQSSSWTYDAAEGDHGQNYRHSTGYWKSYNDTKSGYTITGTWDGWANPTTLQAENPGDDTYIATKTLAANTTYDFLVFKDYAINTYNHIFTYTDAIITSSSCTDKSLTTNGTKYSELETHHTQITTTTAGEYVFKLTPGTDGVLKLSVEYPFAINDYRVTYTWNDGSAHSHSSEIIKAAAGTNETISVFVHKASNVTSQSLTIEECTVISGAGVPTWTARNTISLPAETITENGVYNFIITQPANGYATGAIWNKYTGNYYIRTESSDGGWNYYKDYSDNVMTYSDYSLTQTLSAPFSHYYCRYIENTGMDVTYQIATDYSPCVSDVFTDDTTIGDGETTLPAPANVRFSWNEQTNALRRAYLKSAQGLENTRYLVLHGKDNNIRNNDATGTEIAADGSRSLEANELLFTDIGNWVYQVELKAIPGAMVSLMAYYNGANRYLVGSSTEYETIIAGGGSGLYSIKAVFDFKTNRLMTAWIPGGDVGEDINDVDVLLIRHAQEAGTAITFGGEFSVGAKEVIGAIEMRYDELYGRVTNWTSSSRPLLKFFVSFPFDVNVSDIFGLNSAYGDAYVIEKYDGAERAAKGFFRGDGTTTFWKELQPGDVMEKNVGYCVIMDNDYFNGNVGSIWENKGSGSKVYLYFPSANHNIGDIESTSKTIDIPEHECKHNRTFTTTSGVSRMVNHMNTDSHWNMMGVPIFDTHSDSGTAGQPGGVFATSGTDGDGNFNYFYEWSSSTNQFSIHTARNYSFQSMHSYMVQYHGSVTFKTAAAPAAVAARRGAEKKNYQIELQVLSGDEVMNRAYVELRENACDTFALNEDVYMSFNNKAVNVYTLAGSYDVAANVLSVGSHTVPVCAEVTKAGHYKFSMPSNFSGEVTLIDTFNNERINLAMDDYEVDLPKGVIEDRFLMEININNVVTTIDGVEGEGLLKDGKAHKFLENGIMYILHNNRIYNANGMLVE